MQCERNAERLGRAFARQIIGRRANAAETEHDVPRGEAAPEGLGEPRRFVAQVSAPGKAQSTLRKGADQKREMLVQTLADQDLVADHIGADRRAREFRFPAGCAHGRPPAAAMRAVPTSDAINTPSIGAPRSASSSASA